MPGRRDGFGSCAVACSLFASNLLASPPPGLHPVVPTRFFDVRFEVSTDTPPVQEVALWWTVDDGQRWFHHEVETRSDNLVRFEAATDGTYGFCVLVRTRQGWSAPPPAGGQAAEHTVIVDTVPPMVQVTELTVVDRGEDQVLVASWSAHDAHLGSRPVALLYRSTGAELWELLHAELPNVGRYDWRVPRGLEGQLQVRIQARDQGGLVGSDTAEVVIERPGAAESLLTAGPRTVEPAPAIAQDAEVSRTGSTGRGSDAARAAELYALGLWHKKRGEFAVAADRLLESLALDQSLLQPARELADIYYTSKDYQGALDIYHSILSRHPGDRQSLKGSALALVAQKKYPEALAQLQQALQTRPHDAQTWLDAGDVFLWMGQPGQAQHYWQESIRLSAEGSPPASNAQARLRQYGAP